MHTAACQHACVHACALVLQGQRGLAGVLERRRRTHHGLRALLCCPQHVLHDPVNDLLHPRLLPPCGRVQARGAGCRSAGGGGLRAPPRAPCAAPGPTQTQQAPLDPVNADGQLVRVLFTPGEGHGAIRVLHQRSSAAPRLLRGRMHAALAWPARGRGGRGRRWAMVMVVRAWHACIPSTEQHPPAAAAASAAGPGRCACR